MDSTTEQGRTKLYRSKNQRVLAGVCGGLAEYFTVDPTIVRLLWILITFLGGAGIIGYIIALIIIPENPGVYSEPVKTKNGGDGAKIFGIVLILFGTVLFLKQMDVHYYFRYWDFPWQLFFASFFIVIGGYIIFNKKQNVIDDTTEIPPYKNSSQTFYRVTNGKMVGGVCTGIAEYFDLDLTLVRLVVVFAMLSSIGIGVFAYILALFIFPEKFSSNTNGGSDENQ